MAFIKIEGFAGNIYVPEKNPGQQKNPCRDCYYCQFCSDEKCELCLKKKSCKKKPPLRDCNNKNVTKGGE